MDKSIKQAARHLATKAIADGFQPRALHEYTNADGSPIYWRIRCKHPETGKKWIRPMKRVGDSFEIGEPVFPVGHKPLYRLHRLATDGVYLVHVVEGENVADALEKCGLVATTSGGADSAGMADWSPLAGRRVRLWPDADEVADILRAIDCAVEVVDVDRLGLPPKTDAVDWLAAHPEAEADDVLGLPIIGGANCPPPKADKAGGVDSAASDKLEPSATLSRLAAMPPMEYDRVREQEAQRLEVRVGTLDKEVHRTREQAQNQDSQELVETLEPWSEKVDGAVLLSEIRTLILRYVVLPYGAAEALALWCLGTYCFDAFRIWAKLTITSPEKRCGKTTLMAGVLAALVHRALVASNISPAAVFRVIETYRPTLLIDEADTFLANNDELRGVVNSGHTKSGAFVIRTVGDNHDPKRFSTWAPMAIAMIKHPPGTILDRSIVIELRRRLPGEKVEKLPTDFSDQCRNLRRRCAKWAADHMAQMRLAKPQLPISANDRALDNWAPLIAIAETAGSDWPNVARTAFQHLRSSEEEDDAIGPLILADIKSTFEDLRVEKMHSTELVNALLDLEERPWSEWRHGKPLSTNSLARLLKPFKIKARQLRIGSTNRNGYEFSQFGDAFSRYLCAPEHPKSGIENSTPLQPSNGAGFKPIQSPTPQVDVEFQNSTPTPTVEVAIGPKPSNGAGCRGVEFQNPDLGGIVHMYPDDPVDDDSEAF